MKRFAFLAIAVVLFSRMVVAAPIAPKDISADAKWIGHMDFDAIRALPLVQDMKAKCPNHEACETKMKEMAQKVGLDSMDDLQGVTLYANQFGGSGLGVSIFYAKKFDQQKMIGLMKERHPDNKATEYATRTLYSWTAGHKNRKMDLTGAFAGDGVLVIGADTAQVQAALDVLDGKKPGLTKDSPLVAGLPANVLFAARALDVPEDYRKVTRCPVLRNCKSANVVWSEAAGQITGKYELGADSPEMAANFKAVVDGFKAMGMVRVGNLPAVKKVLDGVKTDVNGASFTATFDASTADIEAAVQAAIEFKKSAEAAATEPAGK